VNDFAFVAILIAFFVLATLFITVCERILGPDEEAARAAASSHAPTEAEKTAA
jgi:hypothetical protein